MQDVVVKTGCELVICVPNHEEKGAIVELLKAISQKPQRTTTSVEVVVEINENLHAVAETEVVETEMVVSALETAVKNVCNQRGN